MARNNRSSTKTSRSTTTPRFDPHTWLERAQAMQIYSNALKEADDKVLKLFDTVSEQSKRYFEFNARLHLVICFQVHINREQNPRRNKKREKLPWRKSERGWGFIDRMPEAVILKHLPISN